jgi:post-segregation antitoxin (ccd killing protein)
MRTSIYLPDDLHESARRMRINISAVSERAVRDAIVNRQQELEATIKAGEEARVLLQQLTEENEVPATQ